MSRLGVHLIKVYLIVIIHFLHCIVNLHDIRATGVTEVIRMKKRNYISADYNLKINYNYD